MPTITVSKKYAVYTYIPKAVGTSSAITIHVFDGKKINEMVLKTADIKVEGQTSGEWAYVGTYNFVKEKSNYIAITNKNADGLVIADAVVLVPER